MTPTASPDPFPLPPSPARTDGLPVRSVTSINLRHEDKAIVNHLHSYWSLRSGRSLKQWDAISLLVRAALENPHADVPVELRRPRGGRRAR